MGEWSSLQALVDDLAERFDAPAVLEDEQQRVVVYSPQNDPIDEVRRDSILHRCTRPDVRDWFRAFGIREATGPLRTPHCEAPPVLGRLCVPIRHEGRCAGFLWFIDEDRRLGADELATAEAAARHAALLLQEKARGEQLGSSLLAHLLSSSPQLRAASARQALDEGMLAESPTWVAVVDLRPTRQCPPAEVRTLLPEALREVSRQHRRGEVLTMARYDHGAVLCQSASGGHRAPWAAEVATEVLDSLQQRRDKLGVDVVVTAGLGEEVDGPTEAHRSYRQARTAAGVAMAVDGDGGMARWDRLGVYRLLAQLPHVEAEAIDPRVVRLLADADHRTIETLEAYLDLAGDAQATAQVLHIHRASLYQRLQKAERLYDFDLHSGTDRLAVHLGLKLARVTGLGAGLGSEDAGGAPAGTEHPAPPWGQIRLA